MTIKSKSYNAREPKPRDVEALVITSAIFFGGGPYYNYSSTYTKYLF